MWAEIRSQADVFEFELRRLSEADCETVNTALHAMAAMRVRPRKTEKTNAVLPKAEDSGDAGTQPDESPASPAKGHGRNGAEAFSGAQKIEIQHQNLKHGDRCPDCGQGNVYGQKEPKVLVRVVAGDFRQWLGPPRQRVLHSTVPV